MALCHTGPGIMHLDGNMPSFGPMEIVFMLLCLGFVVAVVVGVVLLVVKMTRKP